MPMNPPVVPDPAPAPAPAMPDPLDDFVALSQILTGIDKGKLHPLLDTQGTAQEYLDYATVKAPIAFAALMDLYARNRTLPADEIAALVFADADTVWIARSVTLMWYLGAWYEPAALQAFVAGQPTALPPPFVVISSQAYTQGWAWRVGQAHPMGYSDFRFGYWNVAPPSLASFVGGA